MIIRLVIFISTLLIALLGAHVFLYFSIIHFFEINLLNYKLYLIIAIAILSTSFFVSAAFIRLHENFLTTIMYTVSSFWVGLLSNMVNASVILWVISSVSKIIDRNINMVNISIVFLLVSLIITIIGTINAFSPTITNLEVELKNLPPEWKGKTVVQLSDVHLGVINREKFLDKIVKQTNDLNPELVLITGDLFDGMDGYLERFIKPLKEIKSKKGVYFVTGNHEIYLKNEPLKIIEKANITHLSNTIKNINGLQIIGIDYHKAGSPNNTAAILDSDKYDPKKPSILMHHTPTDITHKHLNISDQQWRAYWNPKTDFSFAKKKGIDLQLSGHTHAGQFFPFNLIAKVIFGKSNYGLYKEDNFQLYTSSGTGTWGPPMRTFTKGEIVAIKLK